MVIVLTKSNSSPLPSLTKRGEPKKTQCHSRVLLAGIHVLFLFLLLNTVAHPQEKDSLSVTRPASLLQYFQFDEDAHFACLFTLFPPILLQHDLELKDFVRSKKFAKIRQEFGDKKAVDAIYVRAMNLTDGNTGMALFISALATFEHQVVGLKIPLLTFAFPLTGEPVAEFNKRVANLPKVLYPDSPTDPSGDRDKLQHFFGSAFLSYVFESADAAERTGLFVEKGERAFIQGGTYDDRDLRADDDGARYGTALLQNIHRFPSDFFQVEYAGKVTSVDTEISMPDTVASDPIDGDGYCKMYREEER